jgi:hypothetical protein
LTHFVIPPVDCGDNEPVVRGKIVLAANVDQHRRKGRAEVGIKLVCGN